MNWISDPPPELMDETECEAELRRELKVLLDKYGLWAVAYCLQHPETPTDG